SMIAPTEIHYGTTITIQTAQAAQIEFVTLIRPGVTTHSFDWTQRLVDGRLRCRGRTGCARRGHAVPERPRRCAVGRDVGAPYVTEARSWLHFHETSSGH